jgi:hypothetical protein
MVYLVGAFYSSTLASAIPWRRTVGYWLLGLGSVAWAIDGIYVGFVLLPPWFTHPDCAPAGQQQQPCTNAVDIIRFGTTVFMTLMDILLHTLTLIQVVRTIPPPPPPVSASTVASSSDYYYSHYQR